jgi:hypothetical protein
MRVLCRPDDSKQVGTSTRGRAEKHTHGRLWATITDPAAEVSAERCQKAAPKQTGEEPGATAKSGRRLHDGGGGGPAHRRRGSSLAMAPVSSLSMR